MHIHLSGLLFDKGLVFELENTLSQQGFNLDTLAFEKTRRDPDINLRRALNLEYDYTVFVEDKRFTIAFSDDAQFLRFFYNLCCAPDGNQQSHNLLEAVIPKVEKCVEATKHWLLKDPFRAQKD